MRSRRRTMTVFAVIIINKAGGLIFHRTFHEGGLNQLSTNDYLVLAGTFHGVHAITARLDPIQTQPNRTSTSGPRRADTSHPLSSVHAITARLDPIKTQPNRTSTVPGSIPSRPEPLSGLEVMETENFRLQCFNTLTGTKFLLFTDTTQVNVDVTMRKIYDLYSDYVMKNPFYQLEMPVRCEIFDRKLLSYMREINNR
ncbi:Transport protein particle subunit trs23 like [Verticillium longisporum]|nr:Transport protein particle subunit trs23 like [Verticillium longisporum]